MKFGVFLYLLSIFGCWKCRHTEYAQTISETSLGMPYKKTVNRTKQLVSINSKLVHVSEVATSSLQQNIKMNEMQVTTHIKTTDNDEHLLEE